MIRSIIRLNVERGRELEFEGQFRQRGVLERAREAARMRTGQSSPPHPCSSRSLRCPPTSTRSSSDSSRALTRASHFDSPRTDTGRCYADQPNHELGGFNPS